MVTVVASEEEPKVSKDTEKEENLELWEVWMPLTSQLTSEKNSCTKKGKQVTKHLYTRAESSIPQ